MKIRLIKPAILLNKCLCFLYAVEAHDWQNWRPPPLAPPALRVTGLKLAYTVRSFGIKVEGGNTRLRVRGRGEQIQTTGEKAWHSVYPVMYTVHSTVKCTKNRGLEKACVDFSWYGWLFVHVYKKRGGRSERLFPLQRIYMFWQGGMSFDICDKLHILRRKGECSMFQRN